MNLLRKSRRFLTARANILRFRRKPLSTLCVGKRILILAPHPDDEVLFNYGILSDPTFDVSVVLVSSRGRGYEERLTEFVNCLNFLGRPYYILADYQDGDGAVLNIFKFLMRSGSKYDVVMSPVSWNPHIDHVACAEACRQYVKKNKDIIWLSYVDIFTMGYGNFFYDVSARHDMKVQLFKECYKTQSELENFDFEREMMSRDYLAGTYHGVMFAETYLLEE